MRLRTAFCITLLSLGLGSVQVAAALAGDCREVLAALAANPAVADVTCFVSSDLTTANPATTPPDNSLPGLPPGAFLPRTNANNPVSTGPGSRYPITREVPGLQISGRMADSEMARWLIRLPDTWNGRLLVGVAPGAQCEYSQDITHSNYAVQNGYAYVATNKGHFSTRPTTADDPKACANQPGGSSYSANYSSDLPPDQVFNGYARRTLEATALAKDLTAVQYGSVPRYTYVSGISIGGTMARLLVETHPENFDGAVTWAPPYMTVNGRPTSDGRRHGHENHANFNNILSTFPIALKNFPDYRDSGFSQTSDGFLAMRAGFYTPDIQGLPNPPSSPSGSFFETHYNVPWQRIQCANVTTLDPTYEAPPGGLPTVFSEYDYATRYRIAGLREVFRGFGTTGRLRRPLIDVHGTLDDTALLHGTRLYAADVRSKGRARFHRVYEVENGTHRDGYIDPPQGFTDIEPIGLKFIAAFERLVDWVENGNPAPPSQCIPRGGTIVSDPVSIDRPTICDDGNPAVSGDDDDGDDDDDDGGGWPRSFTE